MSKLSARRQVIPISGSVVGLGSLARSNTVELQDNAGDDLFVTGNTSFTFPTQVTNGGIYNVSVFLQPTSQPQPCNVFNYTSIAVHNVVGLVAGRLPAQRLELDFVV